MRTTFAAALLAASVLAAPAFAQSTIVPMPPAPPPTASGPPMATGIPAAPLTATDTRFVNKFLEDNMAVVEASQLALQRSQDQNIRNYAQKMINDHTAAGQTLMPIASRHDITGPTALSQGHQRMLARLNELNGAAFDRAYIDGMIRTQDETIKDLDNETVHGQSQVINVWVMNTRPVLLQHNEIALQIKNELPRTG
jgi:putative membrane protein